MTIQELANRAEVTTRTIRYYVEQGVLPPPEYGRPAEYTEEHVARLALIKRLKEQYLPLDEIRDTMQRLSLEDVRSLVDDYSPRQKQTKKLDSAADYIANVLGRGMVREQMKQASTRYEPAQPPAPPAPPAFATPPHPEPALAPAQTAPGAQAAALSAAPATPARSLASRLRSSVAGSRSPGKKATANQADAYIQPPTSWQRVQLGKGIELHYLASSDASFNEMVMRLLEAAHRILDEGPGNGE